MAKKKIVYLDDHGSEFESEADADRSNTRLSAEKVLELCWLEESLAPIASYNRAALQPLYDYIGLLMRESDERTKKLG